MSQRLRIYLLIFLLISYVVMQCLFQAVLVPNLAIMQLAVVASWCFLIGFIVAFIAFFLALTKQEQDHQRMEMLHSENVLMERDLSRVFFTKTFAVIYEFIFFNFLIKDRQTSVNLNFHVIKENLKRSKLKLI